MSPSSVDPRFSNALQPAFGPSATESEWTRQLLAHLNLQKHPEGGYYVETDRDTRKVPNPFGPTDPSDAQRSASTSIYYLLTPVSQFGAFHRNKGRTVHTLHRGRGCYVLIHADQADAQGRAPVEAFVVGQDVLNGEKLQWIVEGGKFKASFLLPDKDSSSSDGLLISETVVPGFEFKDHDFLRAESLAKLTTAEQARELAWMVRKE